MNLYGMVGNDVVNDWDRLGLEAGHNFVEDAPPVTYTKVIRSWNETDFVEFEYHEAYLKTKDGCCFYHVERVVIEVVVLNKFEEFEVWEDKSATRKIGGVTAVGGGIGGIMLRFNLIGGAAGIVGGIASLVEDELLRTGKNLADTDVVSKNEKKRENAMGGPWKVMGHPCPYQVEGKRVTQFNLMEEIEKYRKKLWADSWETSER